MILNLDLNLEKLHLFECLCLTPVDVFAKSVSSYAGAKTGDKTTENPKECQKNAGWLRARLAETLAAVVDGLVAAVLEHVLLHLLRGQAVPVLDFRCVMTDLEVVVYLAAGLCPPGVQTAQVVRTSRVVRAAT